MGSASVGRIRAGFRPIESGFLSGRAISDLTVAQQVKLEPPDRIRHHNISTRASEIKCIEGALHNTRTTLYTLFGPGQEGEMPVTINLEDIFGTHLLANAGTLAVFRIQYDAQ